MDEDDDLYGTAGDDAQAEDGTPAVKAENEVDMDGDQDDEEEESDDDVQFTLEKPEGAKPSTPATQPKKQETSSDAKAAKSGTPIKAESQQRSSSTAPPSQPQQQQPSTTKATLTYAGKEGKDFPAVRTSTLDVNATPLWPDANGKPITDVDIDADLAEHSKPWRMPGTDQTDFFNYGFDEFTWAQYAIRQQTMATTLQEQKKQDEAMKAMFGGGGGPGGGPPGGGGGGGMPGMPSEQEMMQMFAQGMTEEQFMQQMMGRGMMGGGPGQGGPQGGGNFGPQGQGFGGGPQGGNFGGGPRVPSGSPHPQGQGFQPPTGPSAQGGQDGGFMGNMEGYSPQQMAIMQQQQGGGGRGRGRGRGRGYY